MKLLIKNGLVITMDEDRKEKFEKLDILIKDDTIIKIDNTCVYGVKKMKLNKI